MVSPLRLFFFLCALGVFSGFGEHTYAGAIYAEQAGRLDWHRESLGKVTDATFLPSWSQRNATVRGVGVITEENVLAVLNQRTGDVVWRKQLESDVTVDRITGAGKQLITLSDVRTKVRSWDTKKGALIWEQTFVDTTVVDLKASEDGRYVLVLTTKELVAYGQDGTARGTITLREKDYKATTLGLIMSTGGGGGEALVLGEEKDQLVVAKVKYDPDVELIEVTKQGSKVSDQIRTSYDSALVGSKDKKSVVHVKFGKSGVINNSHVLPSEASDLRSTQNSEVFYSFADGATTIVSEESSWKLEGLLTPSNTYTVDGTKYVAVAEILEGSCNVRVLNLNKKQVELRETYELKAADHGSAESLFLTGYKAKGGSQGFRLLMVASDNSLSLLQQGEVVWLREEALASITHTLVIDFPLSNEKVETSSGSSFSLSEEIQTQFLNLKLALKVASPDEVQKVKAFYEAKKKIEPAHFEPNGFRKQIVALTSVGKLFALHSSDGRILWTKSLEGAAFLDMWVYKQHPSHKGIEIAILSRKEGSSKSKFTVMDGWSGSILGRKEIPCGSSSVMKLRPVGSASIQAALLIDYEALKAHVVVESDSDLEMLDLQSTFTYQVDEADNAAFGYMISPGNTKSQVLSVINLWSFKLPEGAKIVGSASPNFFQKIYSRTRVLGDRSALYKYTNPNTLFLASESADEGRLKVMAYLLDTVTGKLLYSIKHEDAQGPVHVVFHEHWVVYKYWNSRGNRDEMSVMELYEDEPQKNSKSISSLVFDLLTKTNQNETVSSYAPSALRVLGQSYVLSVGMKTMTVTSSSFGITASQVLLGTLSDQVYAIDKKLLDPRRPVKPSNADKEEGLVPYNEFLPIAPQYFITYTHQVLGLEKIQCYPTRRESTTLMLAYGIDIFYTRLVSPLLIFLSLQSFILTLFFIHRRHQSHLTCLKMTSHTLCL